ncbi:MAG: hypothetical protein IT428_02435 [Planctomycetaceae bacterium]|nr:hypothetical protein [Planctomycetaceae bacterium]
MPTRKPLAAPWIAAAVLLVLIGGYVGAYLYLFETIAFPADSSPEAWAAYRRRVRIRANLESIKPFFAPIHWIDRTVIRRDLWQP